MRATEFISEKWSEKYKRSINCSNPKGFSQRAHCQGRKKKTNEARIIMPGNKVNVFFKPSPDKKGVQVAKAIPMSMAEKVIDSYVERNKREGYRPVYRQNFEITLAGQDQYFISESSNVNYNTARSIAQDINDYVHDIGQTMVLPVPNKLDYVNRLKAELVNMVQDLRSLGFDYDPQAKDFMSPLTVDNDPDLKITEEQLDEILMFKGSPCTIDCSGHRAGYEWYKRKGRVPNSHSQSFNNGANIAAAGK